MRRLRRARDGLLIVNADDYGASPSATDAIIACFKQGAITSATAMVWMADSRRGAELAREHGLPLGLHLNLTLPFRDGSAPAEVRVLQEELTHEFDATSWRNGDPPALATDERIAQTIEQQLREFRAVYGEPTHIDGHHHVHVNPAVLACLPREFPIRPVLHSPAELGRRGEPRDRALRKQFRAPDNCVSIRHIHPAFEGGVGLQVLSFAERHVLEVMVHPQMSDERTVLESPEWREAITRLPLGSYRDLGSEGG